MKKKILTLLFFLLAVSFVQAQIQYKITFGYDSAGNQIQRDRVCANCPSAKAVLDSTLVAEAALEEDLLENDTENTGESGLIAYPNPVTDILKVEWIPSDRQVQRVVLFSLGNRQLLNKKVDPKWNGIDIDFNPYPPSTYIVLVIYSDNSKQSFQVIKK